MVVTQHCTKIAYITNTEMYKYNHELGQTICWMIKNYLCFALKKIFRPKCKIYAFHLD